jgi:hypothetical protein
MAAQQSIPTEARPSSDDFYDEFLKDRGNAIMAVLKERAIDVRSKWLERKASPNSRRHWPGSLSDDYSDFG